MRINLSKWLENVAYVATIAMAVAYFWVTFLRPPAPTSAPAPQLQVSKQPESKKASPAEPTAVVPSVRTMTSAQAWSLIGLVAAAGLHVFAVWLRRSKDVAIGGGISFADYEFMERSFHECQKQILSEREKHEQDKAVLQAQWVSANTTLGKAQADVFQLKQDAKAKQREHAEARLRWFAERGRINRATVKVTIRFVGYTQDSYQLAQQIEEILSSHTSWPVELDGKNDPLLRPDSRCRVVFESPITDTFEEIVKIFREGDLIGVTCCHRSSRRGDVTHLVVEILPVVVAS
jgi:hypothetical protein